MASHTRPTGLTYTSLEAAYDYFNEELFDGQLPPCLITVQRHKGAYGYFSGDRFASASDPSEITDEIALNPRYFATRTLTQILSTLAHEMAHLWQHHFGRPSRSGYHNRQWAAKMCEIGLVPTDTGKPGGKQTGQRISHYVKGGGHFAQACFAFLADHPTALYHDRAIPKSDTGGGQAGKASSKAASKTKFSCPSCRANAWGKPDLHLICGECRIVMEVQQVQDGEVLLHETSA